MHSLAIMLAFGLGAAQVGAAAVVHVDDDAPNDPGPNTADISDPLEDGSARHPFDRIQEAIAAAQMDDSIIAAPGVYVENINLLGKAITLSSSGGAKVTVIDGGHADAVVRLVTGEGRSCIIEGFTIRNGQSFSWAGGVHCRGSAPVIRNNIITRNVGVAIGGGIGADVHANPLIQNNVISDNQAAGGGGGFFCYLSSATVTGNTFSGNRASELDNGGGIRAVQSTIEVRGNTFTDNRGSSGGAIAVHDTLATITNNLITGNSTEFNGAGGGIAIGNHPAGLVANNIIAGNSANVAGGIWVFSASPVIRNNTIAHNTGAGVFIEFGAAPTLTSNIIWENPLTVAVGARATVTYCDVQNGWPGVGNINGDPMFVNARAGNYHIGPGSACLDAGEIGFAPEPGEADIDGQPRVIGAGVDIGADELPSTADTNGDGFVNVDDLVEVILGWGACPAPPASCVADVNDSGVVDVDDLIMVILNWG